jgi:myo-inositol-1(or 4)-monophosphatase
VLALASTGAVSAKTTERALEADWLGVCRSARDGIAEMLATLPASGDRAVGIGRGAGGDETLVIDEAAEAAVFAELEKLGEEGYEFTAISEERGTVVYGDGASDVRVVIDPIDGSLNAKRLFPVCSLSIAVASGSTLEHVDFGYVYEFGGREEYVARLGEGATLNGAPLDPDEAGFGLELVGVEAARPEWIAPVAERLGGSVFKLRIVGSIAVTLSYLATARLDGMLTANTCRSFDVAAAQLVAREAGAFVSVLGHGGIEAPLDLETRFRVAAARTPEALETLVQALVQSGLPPDAA